MVLILNHKKYYSYFKVIGGGVDHFFGVIFSFQVYDRAQWAWAAAFYGILKTCTVVEISRVHWRENGRFL